jgi:hypothetical protein
MGDTMSANDPPKAAYQVGDRLEATPGTKHLLLDGRVVEEVENGRLALGQVKKHPANPLFGETLPWETETSHMYANVLFDQDEGLYRCWYSTHVREWESEITAGSLAPAVPLAPGQPGQGQLASLYAVSADGIVWEKPGLDAYRYQDKPTNIVQFRDHGTGVFKDPRDPDPNRRYKLISGRIPLGSIDVAFSPDGISWSERRLVANARGDTHNNAFWAPGLNRYVAMTREYPDKVRTVLRMESEDFNHWTKPEEVLRGPREAQVYSMPVFPYAGVYIGLPAIFRVGTDKRVHTELAWSADTHTWHRIDAGTELIPLAEDTESHEWGCIYCAACPVVLQDEIRIYYSGQAGPHGWQAGWWCLATLRPDGWAGYEPVDGDRPAAVHTHPVAWSGKGLRVTADAEGGEVVAAAVGTDGRELARSKPLTGEITAAEVRWEDAFAPASLAGQSVRLRFQATKARIYSFAFDE